MDAPDKIYLHGYSFDPEPNKGWSREPKEKHLKGYEVQNAEYIRKDALLEWAKECFRLQDCDSWYSKGAADAFSEVINKIESL